MNKKINISISEELLGLLDDCANDVYSTRSGVVCQALVYYFTQREAVKAFKEMVPLLKSIEQSLAKEGKISPEDRQQMNDLEAVLRMLPSVPL